MKYPVIGLGIITLAIIYGIYDIILDWKAEKFPIGGLLLIIACTFLGLADIYAAEKGIPYTESWTIRDTLIKYRSSGVVVGILGGHFLAGTSGQQLKSILLMLGIGAAFGLILGAMKPE